VEEYDPKEKKFKIFPTVLQYRREDGRGVLVPAKWFPSCIR
jgi:hypothetical protein